MEKRLELYCPHSKQSEFHQSKARYRVCALGRQAGKSTMANNEVLFKAWENPGTRYWFLSPIYAQARDQYRRVLDFLPTEVIQRKSDTELRIELIQGSVIEYKSGEVLDRLRGATIHGVILDELRDLHKDLWPMVIRPMLTTTQGWAAFISTPNGYDIFYDLFQMSLTQPTDWEAFQAPSICNPKFPQSELEAAKLTMSDDVFAQEILAEFREIGVGKAYKNHNAAIHGRLDNPFAVRGMDWSPYLPIIVGLDFNVSLMVWVLGQKRAQDWYWGDEIALENTDTEQCAKVLVEKLLRHKQSITHEMPPVVLVGDASGKSRKTSAVGQTDYLIIERILKEAGIKFENRTPDENPFVKDRVNSVNSLLKSADGLIHMWYHPIRCKRTKKDLERVKWKQGADGAFLDKSDLELTHASDAFGYPVTLLSEIFHSRPGRMRVIVR